MSCALGFSPPSSPAGAVAATAAATASCCTGGVTGVGAASATGAGADTLVKLNVLVSFLTLAMVGGIDAVRAAVMFIPYF